MRLITFKESVLEMKLFSLLGGIQPIQIAVMCSALCALGFVLAMRSSSNTVFRGYLKVNKKRLSAKQILIIFTTALSVYLFSYLITRSSSISLAISALGTAVPFLVNKQRAEKVMRARENAWPEAIDSLVSALQSGVTIADAVVSLAEHGPDPLKPNFLRIKQGVQSGIAFEELIEREKANLASAISDQVFETLLIAKTFGGRDSNNALRLLSEFIRDDIDVIEEIRTKFGWIRNSAVLATAAPWLLLVLLSSQDSTVQAFSSGAGLMILTAGVLMTAIAYLWMDRVGQIPQPARALR